MTNVVSLAGDAIKPRFEPDTNAIELAERILELVRSGEVQGITVCYAWGDGSFGNDAGGSVATNGMVGNLERTKLGLIHKMVESE